LVRYARAAAAGGSNQIDTVADATEIVMQVLQLCGKSVGERVLVTGTLDDRELTLRSLRRVTDSCS